MINGNYDVFDKLEDINYIPVIGGDLIGNAKKEKYLNGDAITFINKNSIFKYNKFLINPYHNANDFPIIVENGNLLDDSIIYADSGGLQEFRYGIQKMSPEDILKWQEKYCDIGFALDKIPFIMNKDIRVDWTFDIVNFKSYAIETKNRIKRAIDVRTEYKSFKYYAIIQGTNYDEYKQWKDIINQPGIDGWCCKSPSNSPMSLAETAVFALENLDKPIHFLGIGNLTKSIILIYLKKYYKNKISFDSATANIGMTSRTYNLPYAFNYRDFYISEGIESDNLVGKSMKTFDRFNFCSCDACKYLDKLEKTQENDKYIGVLFMLHNLNMMLNSINYLKQIYDDKEKIVAFVKNVFKERTGKVILNALQFIDDSYTMGYVEAKKKWNDEFPKFKKTTKQKTLF